ncbi:hypothetical protein ACWDUL_31055, partial [Nocardia niigatensis]
ERGRIPAGEFPDTGQVACAPEGRRGAGGPRSHTGRLRRGPRETREARSGPRGHDAPAWCGILALEVTDAGRLRPEAFTFH